MIVTSKPLELRGIANKETKKGNVYYMVNCEEEDGTARAFYCPESTAFANGLQKGCMVVIDFEVKTYNGEDQLIVNRVHKVE